MVHVAKFGIVIVGRKNFFKNFAWIIELLFLACLSMSLCAISRIFWNDFWARDKKTNALGPCVCDWHSMVVVSKGPFRVGSGEVGIGRGGGRNLRVPPCFVPCRAVPPWVGGGGGNEALFHGMPTAPDPPDPFCRHAHACDPLHFDSFWILAG